MDDIMPIHPQDNRVIEFTDYVIETYTKNDNECPPQIYAEFWGSTIHTINNCKVFHRKWNSLINYSHPNICNFISIKKNIQSET